MDPLNIVLYAVIGSAAIATYVWALRRRVRAWRRRRDDVRWQRLLTALAFLLVAVLGLAGVVGSVAGLPIEVRRLLANLAWGAFFAAGLLFAGDEA